MRRVMLFAGTTEGRILAECLAERKIKTDIFVVSEYGADLLPSDDFLTVHVGRLTALDMENIFLKERPDVILDATHPYAYEVTANIYTAAENCGCLYYRVLRDTKSERVNSDYLEFLNTEEAVSYLKKTAGNIFLTTGSKELQNFFSIENYQDRIYARVLPTVSSAEICERNGIKGKHLIMMQGPFSETMNYQMLKETNAKYLVTKQSGHVGGFEEKIRAAKSADVSVIVIGKQNERIPSDRVSSLEEMKQLIKSKSAVDIKYQKNDGSTYKDTKTPKKKIRKISLIGMGPGDIELVSKEAKESIRKADVLIGAKRVVAIGRSIAPSASVFITYKPDQVKQHLEEHPEYEKIAMLYSGDISVYSGAEQIRNIFTAEDWIEEIHGVSSVDLMCERCGFRREDIILSSIHGRNADIPNLLNRDKPVVVLLGGTKTFHEMLSEIINKVYSTKENRRSLKVFLGENLSYENERFTVGSAKDFLDMEIDSLAIAAFQWEVISEKSHFNGHIPRIMIAAPKSGGGKTTLTCGLIRAFQKKGITVSSFKCGPDYIDPMFHSDTLGVRTGNLDSFFTDADTLKKIFVDGACESDIAVIEGVMGYYDGLGGTTTVASGYEISEITKTPVILAIDAKGASVSLAATINGIINFRKDSRIQGIILNRVSKSFYPRLKAMLEKELNRVGHEVKILGYLPENRDFTVPSRHLGLVSPGELKERQAWADRIANQILDSVDVDKLIEISQNAEVIDVELSENEMIKNVDEKTDIHIAIAKDEAFSFYYRENEEMLRGMGVDLIFFSPIHDDSLPSHIDGLILGGGYPELYRKELSENQNMRRDIREKIENGLPTIAECGGFLYLLKHLSSLDGTSYEMCGMIDADGFETEHLVRFGYFEGKTNENGLFGPSGTCLRGHEFHYWDATFNGDGLTIQKPIGGRSWKAMYYTETIAAGFPHFYYPGNTEAINHFLKVCELYHRRKNERN